MSTQQSIPIMKLVIIGDSSVGKTCLLDRYADGVFNENPEATIGVEYKLKDIKIESSEFKLQLWDTAGQERFRSIAQSYYRGADGAIIVFDITSNESFENISNWIKDFNNFTDNNQNILIVGNKVDLESERKVETEYAKQFVQSKNFQYIETSAKEGTNINEAFQLIEKKIYDSRYASIDLNKCVSNSNSVNLEETKGNKKCC